MKPAPPVTTVVASMRPPASSSSDGPPTSDSGISLPAVGRKPPHPIKFLLQPGFCRRAEDARLNQSAEDGRRDEGGEAVIAGRAEPLDLAPIDVNVVDPQPIEVAPGLLGGAAADEGFDHLLVEDGVVDDRVPDVEDGRLADDQHAGAGR